MKLGLVALVLLSCSASLFAGDPVAVNATLVLREEDPIRIVGFGHGSNLDKYTFACRLRGTDATIPLKRLKSLRMIAGGPQSSGNKAVVELTSGETYEVTEVRSSFLLPGYVGHPNSYFQYLTLDPIGGKILEHFADWPDVRELLIDAVGDCMVDPATQAKFPPTYQYNPFTGAKLVPGSHGQQ